VWLLFLSNHGLRARRNPEQRKVSSSDFSRFFRHAESP
jgi:hypothetical protein